MQYIISRKKVIIYSHVRNLSDEYWTSIKPNGVKEDKLEKKVALAIK